MIYNTFSSKPNTVIHQEAWEGKFSFQSVNILKENVQESLQDISSEKGSSAAVLGG